MLLAACRCLAQGTSQGPAAQLEGDSVIADRGTRLLNVRGFAFDGNTAFSDGQLSGLLQGFTERQLTSTDLEAARLKLTKHYVEAGFLTSGAVLPDQTVEDGIVRFQIIEGRLKDIDIRGQRALNEQYYRSRIALTGGPPLNVNDLRDTLELLRRHPVVETINAELEPGLVRGESRLLVDVAEALPFHAGLRFDNHTPPSVGAERFYAMASHDSLTGNGDRLALDYGITTGGLDDIEWAGVDDLDVSYALPLTAYETTLRVGYSRSDSLVIEEPFADLDIQSKSETFGISLRQPMFRTPANELALAVTFEYKRNTNFLLGEPFDLSPGDEIGRSAVSVIRFSQEWSHQSEADALFLRSTFSFGIDAFGASTGPRVAGTGPSVDGQFIAWLGQGQYVRRIGEGDSQLIFTLAGQLSNDPLLAIEQFVVGGAETVRGYRENQLVRDNGIVSSTEWRIPLIQDSQGRGTLFAAPFFDIGAAWNEAAGSKCTTLASAGVGLLFRPGKWLDVQIYWGLPFRDVDNLDDNLQDYGIHFSITAWLF